MWVSKPMTRPDRRACPFIPEAAPASAAPMNPAIWVTVSIGPSPSRSRARGQRRPLRAGDHGQPEHEEPKADQPQAEVRPRGLEPPRSFTFRIACLLVSWY
jgi:hypothetical protein